MKKELLFCLLSGALLFFSGCRNQKPFHQSKENNPVPVFNTLLSVTKIYVPPNLPH
jgi:hypothetical protein